jgi:Do/DeqQ family serine protease
MIAAESGHNGPARGADHFYSRAGKPIFAAAKPPGIPFMNVVRILTALLVSSQVSWAATAPAVSQERRVPVSPTELRLSYAPIVQRVQPAVVNVYAAKMVQQTHNPLLDDPIFRRFFGVPGQQGEQTQRSLGSGVMVDPSGLVVTNVHVIEGADEVKVSLADKREFEAEIVLKDTRSDLAVLRLKDTHEQFPTLDFANSDELLVGDVVLAIGNPFGVGQTVTHGIISALARTQVGITDYQFFIQTDAAINPGNSGGALVDMTGKLAGINTAIFSRSGGSQGIGFAIPANMVRVVVASAKSGGKAVKRPWLGARLQAVTPEIAETLGLRLPSGALVSSVVPNSPAARAGLKLSDLIVAIDGQSVDDPNAFDYRFATRPLGGNSQIEVQRGGKPLKLSVALEAAPDTGRNEIVLTTRSPFQGAKVANISPAVADELHLDADTEGVVVTDLADDGTAASVGFQKGDIILAVNNQKIAKTSDLEKATHDFSRLWRITLVRGGQQINVTLGG